MKRSRKIAFVVTEDWFLASHFLPMVQAARQAGFEPIVITRVRNHGAIIEAAGARLVPLELDRRSLNPLDVMAAVVRLRRILKTEEIELVHLIAFRSILVGGVAAMLVGVRHRIFAFTGGGLLTARSDAISLIVLSVLVFLVRHILQTKDTQFLFENEDDPRRFGLDAGGPEVTIVGGAGVNIDHYRVLPLPPSSPLKVAIVSRMLWSKGIDIAVEAITRVRQRGIEVELSLYGAPDHSNPRAISAETLRDWSSLDGIEWYGVSNDVREVWATQHIACLPSRGGEGLPKTLLEAAACGRAILTTDVPGCRSFVRDGLEGFVVPSDDVEALTEKLARLASDHEEVARLGAAARRRVEKGFTEEAVSEKVLSMYLR